MAEFEYDPNAISNLIDNLAKADLFNAENENRLITTGANEVANSVKNAIGQSQFNISKFRNKIKVSNKVKKDKSGYSYVTISPSGNYSENGRPRRIAEILFVLNYGRKKEHGEITGDYFWTNGVKKGQKRAEEAMREEVNKIYHERGLT